MTFPFVIKTDLLYLNMPRKITSLRYVRNKCKLRISDSFTEIITLQNTICLGEAIKPVRKIRLRNAEEWEKLPRFSDYRYDHGIGSSLLELTQRILGTARAISFQRESIVARVKYRVPTRAIRRKAHTWVARRNVRNAYVIFANSQRITHLD